MKTYAVRRARTKTTGHYRRPGTRNLYCGKPAGTPNDYAAGVKGFKLCTRCVKNEQAERVAAEETAADHAIDGPTLADRAGMRYALVGTGRRVHYSNNDDTLCGREVTEYTDGLDDRHPSLCARCTSAAEKRAHTRALATAEKNTALAAVEDKPETVEDKPETAEDRAAAASVRDYIAREHPPLAALLDIDPTQAADDARTTATAAQAAHAAAMTTWHAEWISSRATSPEPTLFDMTPDAEQGALFT